jgi:ketosteroid isomerase-like protein
MSQENVEIVRAAYEFATRTGEPPFDAFQPDIVWHTRADLPDSRTYRGHGAMAKLFSEWVGSFDDFRLDVEQAIDAGESVIAVLRLSGRIKGTGHEVEMAETHVCKVLDGKMLEVHEYPTADEALKAVGLAD